MEQYRSLARFYDLTYEERGKDYKREVAYLQDVIRRFKKSGGKKLLDVACGTGEHLKHFKAFDRTGLDLNGGVLVEARKKLPKTTFLQADMTSFSLDQEFDVITCLFSSIGYVHTKTNLQKTCRNFARHLKPGGVALIEPWFSPGEFKDRHVSFTPVEKPGLSIARMGETRKRKRDCTVTFHWLIGEHGEGVRYVKDEQVLGLFTEEETVAALERAGFRVKHYKKGPAGRGLYVAVKE
ncbi:MAG: class I SAM-dependent DNA methyltransferase [Candidatus Woesearchaeota archaeon]